MKRWMAALPLAALLVIGAITALQLYNPDKATFDTADSGTITRSAPERSFPTLSGDAEIRFSPPLEGRPIMVNLFASWCAPCRVEHPLLMALSESHANQVYGLAYKDEVANIESFLRELGDPYRVIARDEDGQGGLDFGLTGVPETFVIDSDGTIILHVRGIIDAEKLAEIRTLLDQ